MTDLEALRELLLHQTLNLNLELTDAQLGLLLRHLDLVIQKNQVLNLTRIVDADQARVLHILDSLLYLPAIHSVIGSPESLVDIGSGAGYPGIPLAIALGCPVLLLDSVQKKAHALHEFVDELELEQVSVSSDRAEVLAVSHPQSFDVVTARAVAELKVLLEYASPLLERDGILVASKAQISSEEFDKGMQTAQLVGMEYVSRETYELPDTLGHREILVFQKKEPSSVKLPRKIGMAKNKPLVP